MRALAIFLSIAPSIAAADPPVSVEQAWARATIGMARPAAAYATVRNDGDTSIALIGVVAEISGAASIHESATDSDGVARMRAVESLTVPAGGSVTLAPGGYHIMLMQLTEPLVEGQTFDAAFQFSDGTTRMTEVPVLSLAAQRPEASQTR